MVGAGEAGDLFAQRVGGEGAGGDNRDAVLVFKGSDLFADDPDQRLGGDGLRDAARKINAIDGQGVACGNCRFIGNFEQGGAGTAHLLLEQPGRRIRGLALEGVGADQLAEICSLVSGREARLAVHDGAHLVEVHITAQARGGQGGFRPG